MTFLCVLCVLCGKKCCALPALFRQRTHLDALEFLFIENVGNLVCPSSYDLGEALRVVLMSVTEGEDKPLKYPTIFHSADVAVITKIDLAGAVGFDRDAARANIEEVRPGMETLERSARTGAGLERWIGRLESFREAHRAAALGATNLCGLQQNVPRDSEQNVAGISQLTAQQGLTGGTRIAFVLRYATSQFPERKMRQSKAVRLTALVVGMALAPSACSDVADPVAPPSLAPTLRAADYDAERLRMPREFNALGRGAPLDRDVVVSRAISPAGGTISLPEAGVSVRFPAGALVDRTRITVTAQAGDRVVYTFEPHGLQFRAPVEVAQLLGGTSAYGNDEMMAELRGAYLPHGSADLDASGVAAVTEVLPVRLERFEQQSGRFVATVATFKVGHFSGYMLASGKKDTTSTAR